MYRLFSEIDYSQIDVSYYDLFLLKKFYEKHKDLFKKKKLKVKFEKKNKKRKGSYSTSR